MRKLIPIFSIVFGILCFSCLLVLFFIIPSQAARIYGPPAASLNMPQRVQYSAQLLWYDGLLTRPVDITGGEQTFTIEIGESVNSVAAHLQEVGLIRDAEAFRAYLIYSGLDTTIQAGQYKLSPTMSAIDIAHEFQDATSEEVNFVILAGWRMEEIAATLPTSGLSVTGDEFLDVARSPMAGYDYLDGASTTEGFLFPDSYVLARNTTATEMVNAFVRNFGLKLLPDLRNGFTQQNLTVYQAVTLASIVEREAVQDEEKSLIASVYLNRLQMGMKLDADPTVQYAYGYDFTARTWWKNPIDLQDLQFNSPYNTYLYAGLPPAPIANPSLEALQAVAFPTASPYYYFRAKCDGSGYHEFSETFEEHLGNGCP
ncbi:MAG TPA: endolytic transglycosylase MltG [Anaerolineales bacterium]|nr:endolytic transglycosylase MltG [Anaerolineales bacterium]